MIELVMDQRKDAWIFEAVEDGKTLATFSAEIHGDSVLVHNEVYAWSRGILRPYLEMWHDIRGVLKDSGVRLIVACSDHYTEKIGKWWVMMGFERRYFGEGVYRGLTVHYAVMEA